MICKGGELERDGLEYDAVDLVSPWLYEDEEIVMWGGVYVCLCI